MTFNNIPQIKIGSLEINIIQGGMGVGISKHRLAAAVANEGGAGIIASVALCLPDDYATEIVRRKTSEFDSLSAEHKKILYEEAYILSNQLALRREIREARRKSNGVIGVNIMHALSNYASLVKTAIEEDIDMIISGAGIPKDLPSYLNGKNTKLIPIVSSVRLAEMICKSWGRQGHLPDAIIVEGPMAGGHLGYSREELANQEFVENGLERIVTEVVSAIKPFETDRRIPVIAAGGIYYGYDIKKFIDLGASGVQMATRFVTTFECDADEKFKQAYIDCKKEDIRIIHSPVGMPGRAISNEFLERVESGERSSLNCTYHCLKSCNREEAPYCIAKSLVNAQQGKLLGGFVFAGLNAYRCKEIVSVKQVMEDLDIEYNLRK